MTRIKLCGLRRKSDIDIANEIKPEYIGFVFYKKSKRYIHEDIAYNLKKQLSSDTLAVGVFVDETIEKIQDICKKGIIDIIQLHGSEDEKYIAKLKDLTKKSIIKAFQMHEDISYDYINNCSADYVLLDSGTGSGDTFDWSRVCTITRPYFLAGGLSEENVTIAINKLHPFAVDVSSGIETNGLKDKKKIEKFVTLVKNAI